ncbi:ABC transporter permease [Amantichitinum ursilacus]|uniref:Putative aliphatic sulfonates transport permease protein SsuC n=1 Tax=Amantichitinum ursilacus TaxID=857265 RepID=A0A0N0GL65_9NEIS|nr:ABC transporter permease [Amantichitinum ursilacus]KPC49607.1 putative aliphatic sulfonates transport permease protein SsuC [Amantichitinum ursilacus]
MSLSLPLPLRGPHWRRVLAHPAFLLVSPLALLALWQAACNSGAVSPQLLVPPLQVWRTALSLAASGDLWLNLSASLYRLAVGFVSGTVLGLLVGALLGTSPRFVVWVGPTFNVLRQVPGIALVPALILLLGVGEAFKIVLVGKAVFFSVALATSESIRAVSGRWSEVGTLYRLSRWQQLRHIALPASLSPVLTGMRIGLNRAWMVLVATELIASESGLGQMMEMARQMFQMDVVMVGIVLTGVIGFGLDRGLRLVQRMLLQRQGGQQ